MTGRPVTGVRNDPPARRLERKGLAGRLVIFDLDGTVSVRQAARQLALPEPTPGQLRAMVGPPPQDGIRTVLGCRRATSPVPWRPTACTTPPVPRSTSRCIRGSPELLAELAAAGATLAVATSKPEVYARRILQHVGLRAMFAGVHGATLDGVVRYTDQIVGRALAAHPGGRAPVLIGDRARDVLGAAAHGLPCVGAGWGAAEPGELRPPERPRSRDVPDALAQL